MNVIRMRRTFRDVIQLLIRTTAANDTYTIPADTGTFTPTVDWGDGTVQALNGTGDANKTHTFAVAGDYVVTIKGPCSSLRTFASVASPFLREILQIRSKSLTQLSFFNSPGLISVCSHFIAPNLTDCTNMLFLSTALTSISATLFTYAPAVTNLTQAFISSGITAIPSGFLTPLTQLTSLQNCWQSCAAISAAVPNNLLTACTLLTDASAAFFSCTSIPTLPSSTFFSTNTLLTTISGIFYNCTAMAGTLVGTMFSTNTLLNNINNIFGVTNIAGAIPLGLFANTTLATSAVGTFTQCDLITSIPANCFSNMPLITSFDGVLDKTSITSLSPGQFTSNPLVTSFVGSFSTITTLPSVPANLFAGNPLVTTFAQCFYQSGPINLPATLFANNIANRSFSLVWSEASAMTAAQYDDLLVNIESTNTATGAGLAISYANTPGSAPASDASRSVAGLAAITALIGRGWARPGGY